MGPPLCSGGYRLPHNSPAGRTRGFNGATTLQWWILYTPSNAGMILRASMGPPLCSGGYSTPDNLPLSWM